MKLTIASTLLASALAFAPSPQFGIVSILKPNRRMHWLSMFVRRTYACRISIYSFEEHGVQLTIILKYTLLSRNKRWSCPVYPCDGLKMVSI